MFKIDTRILDRGIIDHLYKITKIHHPIMSLQPKHKKKKKKKKKRKSSATLSETDYTDTDVAPVINQSNVANVNPPSGLSRFDRTYTVTISTPPSYGVKFYAGDDTLWIKTLSLGVIQETGLAGVGDIVSQLNGKNTKELGVKETR